MSNTFPSLCGALLIAALSAPNLASAQDAFPAPVSKALRAAGVPQTDVAAVVQEIGANSPVLAVNANTPMNPASVMKLVTTYAGLDLLGPAFRWKTEVYVAGTRVDDRLTGHLFLKGYGDPDMKLENFWLLLRSIRDHGVREIDGDLVLDRSYFDARLYDPARFDAEPLQPYNVGPDALLVNFKAIRFQFQPDAENGVVRIVAEPNPRDLDTVNELTLSKGRCGDWETKLKARFQPHGTNRTKAHFTGSYAQKCGERDWYVALFPQRTYVAGIFRQLWQELGGKWTGAIHDGVVPGSAALLLTHNSRPLSEVVRDINKFSNNVMARQLFLTIGAARSGPPARTDSAMRAVRAWLAARGIDAPELVIENGSGLSRTARISALSLVRMLGIAFNSAIMPEYIASMPVVAVDGTMRRRLKRDPVAGQAHIKTGSLADVRAIAGYVLARDGKRYAVAMLINHARANNAFGAMEELLRWTYESPAGAISKRTGTN